MNDLRGGPDQDVGVPDGGHAMLGRGFDANRDRARLEIDRGQALRLGEGEERVGHEVLRVARREVARQGAEEVELLGPRQPAARRRIQILGAHQRRSLPA
jgi:hypothetical protein